jgi:molybdate transport system ATP-binding protein
VRQGRFELDVTLAVPDGQVLGVLGPNGAGKTTVLRALAGLLPLAGGHVRLGGEDLGGRPPERRRVGVVFQDHLLFPHLSALDNVAYAARAAGTGKAAARRDAAGWLAQVGLTDHAGHKPRQLSGGQSQRVALARALASRPRLMLLDEPLAALDAGTRLGLRPDLRRHLTSYGGPTVLVTHDAVEAMVLTDALVVLDRGRIVQSGAPAEVARRPRTDYVARLLGLNLWTGTLADGAVDLPAGRLVVPTGGTRGGPGADPGGPDPGGVGPGGAGPGGAGPHGAGPGGAVHVALRPSAVALHRTRPDGSPRNVWPGRVSGVEAVGDRVRVAVAAAPDVLADVTPDAVADLDLSPGAEVWVSVKATDLTVYPV